MKIGNISKTIRASLFGVGILTLSSFAHAGVELGVVGALNLANVKYSTNTSTTPKTAFGGGVTFGFYSGTGLIGFEIDGLFLQRKWEQSSAEISHNIIQIPAYIRFNTRYLSLGVGGYYAMVSGDVTNKLGAITVTTTPAASNMETSDYGLSGSLRFKLPIGARTNFLIDGRFNYGLKDTLTSSAEAKSQDILVLAGLSFML